MVWSPMILAQYVIVRTVIGDRIEAPERDAIIAHFQATQRQQCGWGFHPESGPYVFVTTLGYIALRLMGLHPDDPLIEPARRWLRGQDADGVLSIPTWGKFWLSMLGLYEYEGVNPLSPEIILLPRGWSAHPDHWQTHSRYTFFAMSFLYGRRFRVSLEPIQEELRRELYGEEYEQIRFAAYRQSLAEPDTFAPPSRLMRFLFACLDRFERCRAAIPGAGRLRQKALEKCLLRITTEHRTSQYQTLSPVNGLLNVLVFHSQGDSDQSRSLAAVELYRWEDAEGGVRYAGTRSSVWDTALVMQACLESPQISDEIASALVRAYSYLQENQIDKELDPWPIEDRDTVLGGWCFGPAAHRWPVSDCTAEALCAILEAHERLEQPGKESQISQQRLEQAVSFVLSRQNADGGFSSFERQRAGPWLEKLNSSEMFGNSGIRDRSYVECTGSCLKALRKFQKAYPGRLTTVIQPAIERGRDFLIRRQHADGSYNASWGINFTYAAFFAAEGLIAAGLSSGHHARKALVHWLLQTQLPDGGWGEHYSSLMNGRYTPLESSRVVMTAWAALALLSLDGAENQAVRRAIAWLQTRQQSDGSWPHEGVNGLFSQSAMLDYRLYQDYFALWAITRFLRMSTPQEPGQE